jgi:hypothetical protein
MSKARMSRSCTAGAEEAETNSAFAVQIKYKGQRGERTCERRFMHGGTSVLAAVGFLAIAIPFSDSASAQRQIALKNGESVDLGVVYYTSKCKSIVIGTPEVEILDGPPELTLTIRPGMVVPRARGCTNPVLGGTLVAMAKGVKKSKMVRLVFRVKYKTMDGDRQVAKTYHVGLFP